MDGESGTPLEEKREGAREEMKRGVGKWSGEGEE